jgi:hypothetical protein
MTRSSAGLVIIIATLAGGCGKAPNDATTAAEVRAVLAQYVKAVNGADDQMLRDLWAEPERISYVNPMQRLRTWGELQGFWQGFLKNSFTRRELTLSNVAGKQYDNRMQVRTGEPSHPMIWMIRACGAEHARPGRHALTKLLREGGQ